MHIWFTRACVTAGTVAAIGLLAAGAASAHVTANSPDATQGGYSVITILVPNESAKATTTDLTVTLPTHKAGDTTLAMAGTSIGDNQFGQFQLSVGKLPAEATLRLPVAQTYSDGSVVKWDEPPKADGSEPDHPAPTVQLAAAGATVDTRVVSATAASTPAPSTSTSDNTARWLGGAGLVLGALGLALGGGVALRSRSRS